MGLAPPDDVPPPDASHDRTVRDAPPSSPDAARDVPFDGHLDRDPGDATRDAATAADGSAEADARLDGAVDGTRRNDAGDGSPPHTGADASIKSDASDPGHPPADVVTDGKGGDVPFDRSGADAKLDASTEASIDASTDPDFDAPSDGVTDATTADGDVEIDDVADGGPLCGFAPPAPSGTCPSVCNDGCVDGICRIACLGEQECKGATIQCPFGFACDINCAEKQSCDTAILVCPDTYACRLLCSGEQSCKALEFNCRSGPCELTCQGDKQACDSTIVNCGADACRASCASPTSLPTLNCGQSCDCRVCL